MNLENLEKLAKWLDAGAPEVVFDMDYTAAQTQSIWEDDASSFDEYLEGTGQTNKSACGTVCCIGGAAYMMSLAPEGQLFPDEEAQIEAINATNNWRSVDPFLLEAAKYLGLPMDKEPADRFLVHDLFHPKLAPEPCAPHQAAAAVRRVMAGEEPWPSHVREDAA